MCPMREYLRHLIYAKAPYFNHIQIERAVNVAESMAAKRLHIDSAVEDAIEYVKLEETEF